MSSQLHGAWRLHRDHCRSSSQLFINPHCWVEQKGSFSELKQKRSIWSYVKWEGTAFSVQQSWTTGSGAHRRRASSLVGQHWRQSWWDHRLLWWVIIGHYKCFKHMNKLKKASELASKKKKQTEMLLLPPKRLPWWHAHSLPPLPAISSQSAIAGQISNFWYIH